MGFVLGLGLALFCSSYTTYKLIGICHLFGYSSTISIGPNKVTPWEDKGRAVDSRCITSNRGSNSNACLKVSTLLNFFNFLRDIQLTSANATMFFVDPPIPDLEQLKES
ncbi:hypothetical protein CASFOL_018650 [Castilleja foliolosa]|uniref:Uncharacterized protein n=1 Tax=Castilleja foliolosa TaxID=1961234 RepID=A0ABD3D671_9LAMI